MSKEATRPLLSKDYFPHFFNIVQLLVNPLVLFKILGLNGQKPNTNVHFEDSSCFKYHAVCLVVMWT